MAIYTDLPAITAVVAGILILAMPRHLIYIVAIYPIVIGVVGLVHIGGSLPASVMTMAASCLYPFSHAR
jgi:hypothetical protein